MKREIINIPQKSIIGVSVRTNNKQEMDPATAKIAGCYETYFGKNIPEDIPNRVNPGVTLCTYSDYESDASGDYTFLIGEEVSPDTIVPEGLQSVTIPEQTYARLTFGPGAMPDVVIQGWQQIWALSAEELGGTRAFKTDFEVYDQRAQDLQNAEIDICLGIR